MSHARICLSAALLAMLAACGADGIPERPEPRGTTAITIAVDASAGISSGN
ncbi:MAG: argininosuccinate lyase [Proteobacteria bacterium]|nr:argininosuccinate lyase [Pseudomonadota bacterium]